MLTGNLSETTFADLIQLYTLSRQTAALTIVSPAGPEHDGVIYVENGDLVDARFGSVQGAEAVRRALRLTEGEFRVELNVRARQRTIFEPWSKLVLDEMVAGDEAGRTVPDEVEIEQEESMIPKSQPQPARRRSVVPIAVASAVVVASVVGGLLYWRGVKEQQRQEAAAISEREAAAAAARHQADAQKAARPSVRGVTDTEITFGISAPFSGPAKELGRGMKTGIDIAFAAVNEAGGVNGRKLKLVALDDGYEPERTKAAMKELAETRKVFGFLGNVGTPTAEVAVPYALEKKMLFFGPFTGAGLLRREPPDRYVFNYRASYAEETAAMVKYLVSVRRIPIDDIAVFAQQDGYGDAGFNGVARMLRKYNRDPQKALRVGYQRNTSDVAQAVEQVLAHKRIRAVVMVPTYKAAARFIDKVKAERPDMIFGSVSFVGSQALADELMSMSPKDADGVMVTQVVPLPQSNSTAVLRYQELLPRYSLGEKPDFVSLEGYLAANLLIEGLRKAGRDFTTETLIDALESLRGVDLGVGAPMSFGMSEHQASHKVWGTVLDATGVFRNIDLE
ncbi:MAG TPA: ABC transporter substrate-binding protein [Myxococcales bacterium]|nr:ABC transporter substrate-binding protein [Myxococcales bacterium]